MTYEQVKHLRLTSSNVYAECAKKLLPKWCQFYSKQSHENHQDNLCKLSLEDQVLTTLEYLREYRTYFHIAQSWQVNESTAYRIIRKVEDCLMNSGVFSLPSKKKLLEPNHEIEIVVVDVTETPIERPKNNKDNFTVAKRNGTRSNPKL